MTSVLSQSPEHLVSELGQLLQRLELSLLHPDKTRERSLRTNEFERARLQNNLQYGFTLYSRLEDTYPTLRSSTRQKIQSDLSNKHDLLDLLQDRLKYLNDLAATEASDNDDDDLENSEWTDDDIFGSIIPTPSEKPDPQSTTTIPPSSNVCRTIEEHSAMPGAPTIDPLPTLSTTTTAQFLRPRTRQRKSATPQPEPSTQEINEKSTAETSSREKLFGDVKSRPADPMTTSATAEAILDNQRAEQDELLKSITKIAAALKQSALGFSDKLDEDKEIVGLAVDGISKTEQSMKTAQRSMSALRRVSEGMGWWDRKLLFLYVYLTMIGLVLLVFVMPKLRF